MKPFKCQNILIFLISALFVHASLAIDSDHDTLDDAWEASIGRDSTIPDYIIKRAKDHSCVLDDKGVYCWGDNTYQQSMPLSVNLSEITGVTGLSVGDKWSCACTTGGPVCWGDNPPQTPSCSIDTTARFTRTRTPSLASCYNLFVDVQCSLNSTAVACETTGDFVESTVQQFSCVAPVIESSWIVGQDRNLLATNPAQISLNNFGADNDRPICIISEDGFACWLLKSTTKKNNTQIVSPGIREVIHGFSELNLPQEKFWLDADKDGVPNSLDSEPFNPLIAGDHDGDGLDSAVDDNDDDGDNRSDTSDAFPLDSTEQYDHDGDRIGNNADQDDDNDGLTDDLELSIGTSTTNIDSDGDGLSDSTEVVTYCINPKTSDTDGDGIYDQLDPEPDSTNSCTMPLGGLYKGVKILNQVEN